MLQKIRTAYSQLADFFVCHFMSSFRSTVMSIFVPLIVTFVVLTAAVSYLLAMRQIEDSARHEVENLVYQTRLYIDSRFESILEQMTVLGNDPVLMRVMGQDPDRITPSDYLAVQSHVDTVRLYNSSIIDTVYINMNHGRFIFSRGDDEYGDVNRIYADYGQLATAGNANGLHWRTVSDEPALDTGQDKATSDFRGGVVDVYQLIGDNDSSQSGIVLFRLRREFFTQIFAQSLLGGRGYLTLIGPEGEQVAGAVLPDMQLDQETLDRICGSQENAGYVSFTNSSGSRMMAVYDTLETNHWRLTAVFHRDALLDKIKYIKYTTIATIIVLLILAVFLTNWLAKYVMRPISDLIGHMESVRASGIKKSGELPANVEALPEDSIRGHGLDDLMERVRELMAQVRKDQELQRELELSVVQMQVHPHFLYNTLFAIKGLCDMKMDEDASKMILALANFFRIGLSHGQEIISVDSEIEHVRNYLYIQEMRYGDVFRYELDFEPDIGHYSIIKLTLQPLVENAIYHGVKEKRGKGLISIKGWVENDMLHFIVRDDGMGMSEARLTELRRGLAESRRGKQHVGFGVFSVYERLRLHYGERAGLDIKSQPGQGTTVEVVLPAQPLEESKKNV